VTDSDRSRAEDITSQLAAGAWDCYCHTSPCLMPRWGSALDVARAAARDGFTGIVLQSHHESTGSRAAAAAQVVPGVAVIGGITLNRHVGGISAIAVRSALRTGAGVVWLPTVHSTEHIRQIGAGRSLSGRFDPVDSYPGLAITRSGQPTAAMMAVLDEIATFNAVLSTGHASQREIDLLLPHAADRDITMMINHPYFLFRPSDGWLRDLPEIAFVQLAAVTEVADFLPLIDDAVRVIDLMGPGRCVVGSETQRNPPTTQVVDFGGALIAAGVSTEAIRAMLSETPPRLLANAIAGVSRDAA
jgi:hypothetical protein